MKPITFPESNTTLTKPKGMTDDECGPLPVYRQSGTLISCWRLSLKDALAIIIHRRVWLWVWSGTTQPPVALGTKDPFKK